MVDGDADIHGAPEDRWSPESTNSSALGSQGSVVFSGGGTFLSKYKDLPESQRLATEPVRRSKRQADGSRPERHNIWINQSLVRARSVDKVLSVVDSNFDQFNVVNVVTALHRVATVTTPSRKASYRRDARFKKIVIKLGELLRSPDAEQLKPQDLSNVTWALTKLGVINAMLFGHLSDRIMMSMQEFQPVNISMTVWALARANFLDERLFRTAAVQAKAKLEDFQPQQIANTCWAFAKAGFKDDEMFSMAAKLSIKRKAEFKPLNFSSLLCAFAQSRSEETTQVFETFAGQCNSKELLLSSSDPNVACNLAWAFAEIGEKRYTREVFDTIAEVTQKDIMNFRPDQVIQIVQSFAKVGIRNEKFLDRVTSSVSQQIRYYKDIDLANLMSALEQLGYPIHVIQKAQERSRSDGRNSPWQNACFVFAVLAAVLAIAKPLVVAVWPQAVRPAVQS